MIDDRATMETTELRDLAHVLKRAIGILMAFWTQTLPPQHPYRRAAQTILVYLEKRYKV